MIGLSTVKAALFGQPTPCGVTCNFAGSASIGPCFKLVQNMGRDPTFEERKQLRECLKPEREAFNECMRVCTAAKPPAKKPSFRV